MFFHKNILYYQNKVVNTPSDVLRVYHNRFISTDKYIYDYPNGKQSDIIFPGTDLVDIEAKMNNYYFIYTTTVIKWNSETKKMSFKDHNYLSMYNYLGVKPTYQCKHSNYTYQNYKIEDKIIETIYNVESKIHKPLFSYYLYKLCDGILMYSNQESHNIILDTSKEVKITSFNMAGNHDKIKAHITYTNLNLKVLTITYECIYDGCNTLEYLIDGETSIDVKNIQIAHDGYSDITLNTKYQFSKKI